MPPCGVAIKQSKMPLRRRQGERQKAIGKQNNILARASRFARASRKHFFAVTALPRS